MIVRRAFRGLTRVGAALACAGLLASGASAYAQTSSDGTDPMWGSGGVVPEPGEVVAQHAAVAADHPLASAIGVAILQRGGNAADAAVAVGLTLGVVNPFASGLGGGGFLLWHDGATGEVTVLDFRETAPAAAHRDMYVADGEVLPDASRTGGLAVAVPGELAGWWALHERYGQLPWADVVEPARRLAAEGFEAGSLLEDRLASSDRVAAAPALAAHFSVDGELVTEGERVVRAGLGEALARIGADGPVAFYEGDIAEDIVDAVQATGGVITLQDLASFEPTWRDPVVSTYRGHTVYGMPSPSSGGTVIAQVLDVLEAWHLGRLAWDDAMTAHLMMQALMHAFADRSRYMGDADFVDVPVDAMRSDARVADVRAAIRPDTILAPDDYGPPFAQPDDAGTSHFSVVDAHGNAVACTTTINLSFGSTVLTETFDIVLNNEMDDFAAQPGVPNAFGLVMGEANAIEAGKRPLSSMSPTIVTDDEGVVGVLGGSGGPMIITGTLQTLLQIIDHGRTPGEAVSAPRLHHQWMPFQAFVEPTASSSWLEHLPGFGYQVVERSFGSAVQAIWRVDGQWRAASDPRKHGVAAGY